MDIQKFAVLIDAENIPSIYAKFIFSALPASAKAIYLRAYGDWTNSWTAAWKQAVTDYPITPIQQFPCNKSKNSTDIALVIDAMDILQTRNVDGFCIVSGDGDYTRLATRLREGGMHVMGMAQAYNSSPAFIKACDEFVFLDKLYMQALGEKPAPTRLDEARRLIDAEFDKAARGDGRMKLSVLANALVARKPGFTSKHYGSSKLSKLIERLGTYDITYGMNGKRMPVSISRKGVKKDERVASSEAEARAIDDVKPADIAHEEIQTDTTPSVTQTQNAEGEQTAQRDAVAASSPQKRRYIRKTPLLSKPMLQPMLDMETGSLRFGAVVRRRRRRNYSS